MWKTRPYKFDESVYFSILNTKSFTQRLYRKTFLYLHFKTLRSLVLSIKCNIKNQIANDKVLTKIDRSTWDVIIIKKIFTYLNFLTYSL